MEAVCGSPIPGPVVEAAPRVFDSVPDEGAPSSVGYFPGRNAAVVRVCVGGLGITGTAVALWKLGLADDPRPVQQALLGCRSRGDGILAEVGLLHLDIGQALGSRAGVELVFSLPQQLSGSSSMPLFDHLESLGLADAGLCQGVRSWPGETRVGDHPAFRILNHVKVVLVDGGIVEAKAYVGIRIGLPEMMAQEARR